MRVRGRFGTLLLIGLLWGTVGGRGHHAVGRGGRRREGRGRERAARRDRDARRGDTHPEGDHPGDRQPGDLSLPEREPRHVHADHQPSGLRHEESDGQRQRRAHEHDRRGSAAAESCGAGHRQRAGAARRQGVAAVPDQLFGRGAEGDSFEPAVHRRRRYRARPRQPHGLRGRRQRGRLRQVRVRCGDQPVHDQRRHDVQPPVRQHLGQSELRHRGGSPDPRSRSFGGVLQFHRSHDQRHHEDRNQRLPRRFHRIRHRRHVPGEQQRRDHRPGPAEHEVPHRGQCVPRRSDRQGEAPLLRQRRLQQGVERAAADRVLRQRYAAVRPAAPGLPGKQLEHVERDVRLRAHQPAGPGSAAGDGARGRLFPRPAHQLRIPELDLDLEPPDGVRAQVRRRRGIPRAHAQQHDRHQRLRRRYGLSVQLDGILPRSAELEARRPRKPDALPRQFPRRDPRAQGRHRVRVAEEQAGSAVQPEHLPLHPDGRSGNAIRRGGRGLLLPSADDAQASRRLLSGQGELEELHGEPGSPVRQPDHDRRGHRN